MLKGKITLAAIGAVSNLVLSTFSLVVMGFQAISVIKNRKENKELIEHSKHAAEQQDKYWTRLNAALDDEEQNKN